MALRVISFSVGQRTHEIAFAWRWVRARSTFWAGDSARADAGADGVAIGLAERSLDAF